MLKHLTVAATALVAIALSPAAPVVVGTAFAQSACTTNYCRPPRNEAGGSTYSCTTELGHLRRVYSEDLEAIGDPNYVSVVEVCVGESYGVMRSDGNAGSLRQAIAGNDAMEEALFRRNFGADDVVGVRMTGDESVILYVHPFHHL